MAKVRFTWDQEGQVMALAEPPDDILAHYLSDEVRNDPRLCRRLLDIIRALHRAATRPGLPRGSPGA